MQHGLLPIDARMILQRAAQTEIPLDDPLARLKAIENAERQIRLRYPSFFRSDEGNDGKTGGDK